ncbi:hypothetical protein T484DRAFT_1844734 [Baffinella frigidus]|nr:hypothetical protein T484DRAFT_1844734 [Cryptophyta sp. CCMP2293]
MPTPAPSPGAENEVVFLSTLTLGKRWYALRVEPGEGDEDGVRVRFPAVVEVTDGESVWGGGSTLHEFLDRAQLRGKPPAAADRKGQKDQPISFEEESGTLSMRWTVGDGFIKDIGRFDWQLKNELPASARASAGGEGRAAATLHIASSVLHKVMAAGSRIRNLQSALKTLQDVARESKEEAGKLRSSEKADCNMLRGKAFLKLNALKDEISEAQAGAGRTYEDDMDQVSTGDEGGDDSEEEEGEAGGAASTPQAADAVHEPD